MKIVRFTVIAYIVQAALGLAVGFAAPWVVFFGGPDPFGIGYLIH